MFKVNIREHENTMEELKELENTMKTERENQLEAIENMTYGWQGATAMTVKTLFPQMLNQGLYDRTYRQTCDMRKTMEEALPELKALKSQCDTFQNCLEGGMPSKTGSTGGNVMLDREQLPTINEACDSIVQCNRNVKNQLQSIMDMCSGIVDFGNCEERLEEACRKVDRIADLKDEINDYAKGVRDLDENLRLEYMKHKDEEIMYKVYEMEHPEAVEKIKEMEEALEEKNLTLEQYRAAVLDTLMYLDFFDSVEGYYEPYEKKLEKIHDINELLIYLEENRIYTDPEYCKDSTRYIYYNILKDAVEKDPTLGDFQIHSMSRSMEGKDYNRGTNGITLIDPLTGTVYVTFRGTSQGEWGDDGRRFSVKDFESMTPQMRQTLDYFETVAKDMKWNENTKIIVTGHSQGGNDSQTVTLFSDYGHYVSKCYSFDGEGHSPDFIEVAKKHMNEKYGEGEYESRIQKMYSICGEYDFVNRLGERVFLEDDEHTVFVHCNCDGFARWHDIVSMFCVKDENGNFVYSGTINTAKGIERSLVIDFTADVWDEIRMMPDYMRDACQDAIMNMAEVALSGGKCKEGLNGEKASLIDYIIFMKYGPEAIVNAGKDTAVNDFLVPKIEEYTSEKICRKAKDLGFFNEKQADYIKNIMNSAIEQIGESILTIDKVDDYLDKMVQIKFPYVSVDFSYAYLTGEQILDYVYKSEEKFAYTISNMSEFAKETKDRAIELGKKAIDYAEEKITDIEEAAFNLAYKIGDYAVRHTELWLEENTHIIDMIEYFSKKDLDEIKKDVFSCIENGYEGLPPQVHSNIEAATYMFFNFVKNNNITDTMIKTITANNKLEKVAFGIVKNPVGKYLAFYYDDENDNYHTNETYGIQRFGGFMDLYDDIGVLLGMDLDTEYIEYSVDGVYYRLQLWKGEYGFGNAYGSEIGLYSTTDPNSKWYECVSGEEEIWTEQILYDINTGEELMRFSTDEDENQDHFWNLMIRTDSGYSKEDLQQVSIIDFGDEEKMKAVKNAVETKENINCYEYSQTKLVIIY